MAVIDRATLDMINLIRSQNTAAARSSAQMRGNEIIGQGIASGTANFAAGIERGRDRRQHQLERTQDVDYRDRELQERQRRTDVLAGRDQSDNSFLWQLANHQPGQPLRVTTPPKGDESDFFAEPPQPGDIRATGHESPETMRYGVSEMDRVNKENQSLQRAQKQREALLADAKTPEDVNIINAAGPQEVDNLLTARFAHNYKAQSDQAKAQAGTEMMHKLIESGAWGHDANTMAALHGRVDAAATSPETFNARELSNSFDSATRPRPGIMSDTQRAQRGQEITDAYSGLVDPKYMPAIVDAATHGVPYSSLVTKAVGESGGDQKVLLSVLRERRATAKTRADNAIFDPDPAVRKAALDDLDALTQAHEKMLEKMLPKGAKGEEPAKEPTEEEMNAALDAAMAEGLKDKAAILKRAREILKGGK